LASNWYDVHISLGVYYAQAYQETLSKDDTSSTLNDKPTAITFD
jgi:hypothetical protein